MRKILPMIATLALLVTACGGGDEAASPEPTAPTGATGATADTGATGATADECVDLTTEGDTFTIVMGDDFFDPACFTADADQGITIVNEGIALHNFTIVDTMVDVDVQPGDTFQGEPVAGVVAPGTYELICTYHEVQGMIGEVTVV